jgi:hypothetical protein
VLANGDLAVTYHFSLFRVWRPWLFEPGLIQKGARLTPALRRGVYIPYFRELRQMARLARRIDPAVPARDVLPLRATQPTFVKMLRRRSYLVVTDTLAL